MKTNLGTGTLPLSAQAKLDGTVHKTLGLVTVNAENQSEGFHFRLGVTHGHQRDAQPAWNNYTLQRPQRGG
jgi:hypothetical protein